MFFGFATYSLSLTRAEASWTSWFRFMAKILSQESNFFVVSVKASVSRLQSMNFVHTS